MYQEVNGDLFTLAKNGKFDVIVHGCNCMSVMSAGIALEMAKRYNCHRFKLEEIGPSIEKLGCIDYETLHFSDWDKKFQKYPDAGDTILHSLTVVNAYTQYYPSVRSRPLDYEALTLCMRKINHTFKGKYIGMPMIGAGLAGGDWNKIRPIIERELKDCLVTVVVYNK